jgi:hypothetical protein
VDVDETAGVNATYIISFFISGDLSKQAMSKLREEKAFCGTSSKDRD